MKIRFKALGTNISIQIVSDDALSDLKQEIKGFYKIKEKIFSRFNEESELYFLNNNLGQYISASSDIMEIARKSLFYHKETREYFDPRVIDVLEKTGYNRDFKKIQKGHLDIKCPSEALHQPLYSDLKIHGNKIFFGRRMDFSGIAKGYITDKICDFLRSKGYRNFLIDSGGDMRISGKDENGENWKISIEGIEEDRMILELDENFPAVATSGITRRKWEKDGQKFHHLVNPKNPKEYKFDLKTVTVIGKNCEEADVWAKVLFLMGKEEGLKFSKKKNIKSLFLDYKGNIFVSDYIKDNIKKYE